MKRFLAIILGLGLLASGLLPAVAGNAPRMDKEQLKALLGKPELVLIDVRSGDDWKAGTQKIAGAVREDPDQVDTWMNKYPKDKTLIFYCA